MGRDLINVTKEKRKENWTKTGWSKQQTDPTPGGKHYEASKRILK